MTEIVPGPSKIRTIEVIDFDRALKVLGGLVDAIEAEARGSDDPEVWRDLIALGFLERALTEPGEDLDG